MLMAPQYKHLDESRPWNDRAQLLECVMIIPECANVKTFCFQTTDESWFRYMPGQFITLELPIPDGTQLRTYTLSSSPSRPLCVSVTVKAQRDSVGSRWMLDHLKVGDRLKAYGPAGIFSFYNHPAQKYLFVSAGSGVTPMTSMSRWLFDYGRHTDIVFINCARRPSEIIFRNEIERMSMRVPDIKLAWVVEEPDPYDVWTGFRGRLNGLMLELIAPDYFEREIFCCGPTPFMQGVRDILNAAGFDMAHYHEESFQAPVRSEVDTPAHQDVIPDGDVSACLVFATSGVEAACTQTDTILDVAQRSGLNVPHACLFGVCGTCKVRRLAGETHMVHNGGITDADIVDGWILACCTRPLGRVEIEV
jgi:ferredoxin-NADP reductase